jgi:hypothetical protein
MPLAMTKKELIKHLNKHYADESLLVADIWSSADVEMLMSEPDEDTSMDIWADIADDFAGQFDTTISILNDTLYEMVTEKE